MRVFNINGRQYFNALILTLVALVIPTVVFAADILLIIAKVALIVNAAIPVAASLALLYFFWGVGLFILHSGDEAKRKEGRQIMIWGIIALFSIVTVWGLVALIQTTFGINPLTATAPSLLP
jgi:hypothetical protein